MERQWPRIGAAIALACLAILPVAAALPRLGFYSDDYAILLSIKQLSTQPWPVFIWESARTYPLRPGQGVYAALFYRPFGLDPVPYHLAQTAFVVASVLALWAVLRRFSTTAPFALPAAAVFALLPQLSTIRVWFAAASVPASLFFFLLGTLPLLNWLRRGGRWRIVASISAWLISLSFYELFMPFMVAVVAWTAWRRRRAAPRTEWHQLLKTLGPHVLIIAAVFGAKALVVDRGGGWNPSYIVYQAIRLDYDPRTEDGFNLKSALITNFWETLVLPLRTASTLFTDPAASQLLVAIASGVLMFAIAHATPSGRASRTQLARAAVFGAVIFALGYGMLLIVPAVNFSAAGIGNRTAVAAAIGVALIFSTGLFALARLAPGRLRRAAAGMAFGLCGAALSLRATYVTEHWASAYSTQLRVLAAARADLADVPPGSTIFLDGLCPYDGPAIVFETDWDVDGALSLALDRELSANILGPNVRFRPSGIHASIYGESLRFAYSYGPNTLVYNPIERSRRILANARDAAQYEAWRRRRGEPCPQGFPGHGLPV